MNIKKWYEQTYTTDELGREIAPDATFDLMLSALGCGCDIYETFGVGDSVIRERITDECAKRFNISTDDIDKIRDSKYAFGWIDALEPLQELKSAMDMLVSIMVYDKPEWEKIPNNRYMKKYIDSLGTDTIKQIFDFLQRRISNIRYAGTDSDGCTYNTFDWKYIGE